MKLGKVGNRETETRIDPYILAREIRETTRKGEEKMKLGKVEIGKLRSRSALRHLTSDLSVLTSHL